MSHHATPKAVAAALGFALSAANAQATDMWVACHQFMACSHDSRGQFVADEAGNRQMSNGEWYRIEYNSVGPIQGVDLYYANSNCQGPGYLWTGNPPWDGGPVTENYPFYAPNDGGKKAGDGGAYWVPKYDTPVVFTPKGFKYIAQNRPDISGVCQALTGNPIVGHLPQIVDDKLFPPYGPLR